MSLQSYEAIYDHGQMKWLGDRPQVEEARVIVTILSDKVVIPAALRHQPSARIAGKGKILGELHRYGVAVIDLENDELTQGIINA